MAKQNSEHDSNGGTTRREMKRHYTLMYSRYKRLGVNLQQALELLLSEAGIKYLTVEFRIKDRESFLEKVERKGYDNPFDQMDDICGLRIVCYLKRDATRIGEIIKKEFMIVESVEKGSGLDSDRFGYRSDHYIAIVKDEWVQTPNFRGLKNLKAEIQVRTVLMHTWAEIEHQLSYKKREDIPEQFQRKFSRISAKLEEADEQFEELVASREEYQRKLREEGLGKHGLKRNLKSNLDNLQAFLDLYFPDRDREVGKTRNLLEEIIRHKIPLDELVSAYKIVQEKLPLIESEQFGNGKLNGKEWSQVGVVRKILDLTNDDYAKRGLPKELEKRINKNKSISDTDYPIPENHSPQE